MSKKDFQQKEKGQKQIDVLMNERIYFPEMRVIDQKGEMIGILSKADALQLAEKAKLDLVVIADNAIPPVARIIDYGKYLYEQEKQKKENKKKQKVVNLKEIKLKPNIGLHDLDVKIKHIRKFIENQDKVKITMSFMGRQRMHIDPGVEVINNLLDKVSDICEIEKRTPLIGNFITVILAPRKK